MKPKELIKIRRAAGISQEEAAKLLHVDRTTVLRWENGTRSISRMAADQIRSKLEKVTV